MAILSYRLSTDAEIHQEESPEYSCPHVIMTYTALLSLAILRDDFAGLDRPGIVAFLRGCQREDGRYFNDTLGHYLILTHFTFNVAFGQHHKARNLTFAPYIVLLPSAAC